MHGFVFPACPLVIILRMAGESGEREVQEVEVERLPRPEEGGPDRPSAPPRPGKELRAAVGPIVSGIVIDVLDAATMTPVLGLTLGIPLGYLIARQAGLRGRTAVQLALVVGLYCGIPGTFGIPLGTIVGTWIRVRRLLEQGHGG